VLIGRLGVERVDWIGTSMGGLIGMLCAAQPQSPVARLVINDVGPFIPKAALERIGAYVGADPVFADLAAAEAYFRRVHAPFGALGGAEWRHLAETSTMPAPGGSGLKLRYDARIGAPFKQEPLEDVDLWAQWDRIGCPTLVLRGADSDLLPAETAAEMTRRGPRAALREIAGCGHAPALMDGEQTGLIRDWLLRE
jgi:pimeloyl-ACP methyl ester carboxylesterase